VENIHLAKSNLDTHILPPTQTASTAVLCEATLTDTWWAGHCCCSPQLGWTDWILSHSSGSAEKHYQMASDIQNIVK